MTARPSYSWAGLADLDDIVGPVRPSRLHAIGARPSCGKTRFMLCLFDAFVSAGLKVAGCFTERSPDQFIRSWAALRLGMDEDAVLNEDWHLLPAGSEALVSATMAQMEEQYAGHTAFIEAAAPSVSRLVADVQIAKRDMGGVDVVMLDYLQKVQGGFGDQPYVAWGKMMAELQSLANSHGPAVFVTSQLHRSQHEVFDKYRPPTLDSGKGTGAIEECADVYLGLFRPLRPMAGKDEQAVKKGEKGLESFAEPNTMAVKVLKHRYRGKAGDRIIKVHLDPITGRIGNYAGRSVPVWAGDAYEPETPF